jgi:hypothetical protein
MKPPIPPKPTTPAEIAELCEFALMVQDGWMEARAERERRRQRANEQGGERYVAQTSAANGRG